MLHAVHAGAISPAAAKLLLLLSVNSLPLECNVAALNGMSWAMELQKRIVSVATSKVKHLSICSLEPSTVASNSFQQVRHKLVVN